MLRVNSFNDHINVGEESMPRRVYFILMMITPTLDMKACDAAYPATNSSWAALCCSLYFKWHCQKHQDADNHYR
jgi:hypothetical protein